MKEDLNYLISFDSDSVLKVYEKRWGSIRYTFIDECFF